MTTIANMLRVACKYRALGKDQQTRLLEKKKVTYVLELHWMRPTLPLDSSSRRCEQMLLTVMFTES